MKETELLQFPSQDSKGFFLLKKSRAQRANPLASTAKQQNKRYLQTKTKNQTRKLNCFSFRPRIRRDFLFALLFFTDYNLIMRKILNQFFKEFIIFTGKQARASIFGYLLLFAIIITKWINFSNLSFTRYDVIFLIAIFFQFVLITTKAESKEEIKVIFLFHVLATIMELFKTNPKINSWQYPGQREIFMLGTVPLFTGFLYSSVGSYIARA